MPCSARITPLTDEQRALIMSCWTMMLDRVKYLMRTRRMDRDEAFHHATDRLIYAARSFDPKRNAVFSTHAHNCMYRWGRIRHTAQELREWDMNRPIEGILARRSGTRGTGGQNSAELFRDYRTTQSEPTNADDIARLRVAMANLDNRTATIVALRANGYTCRYIGRRIMGLSHERVRQIERKGVRQLRAMMGA